ncbi:MAG: endonuclease/exonuclease/phosphatase family protein [Vicingaceae bacterium]
MVELVAKNYIKHNLHQYFDEIKLFKTKSKFIQSAFYKEHQTAIENVINGLEWDNTLSKDVPLQQTIRIVSWNIERGKQLDAIIHYFNNNEELKKADIILAIECDNGMGRTANRNISKELAEALKLNYCFAPSYLVLGKGALGETNHSSKNTISLHGTTILSKYIIKSAKAVAVPPVKEVFHSSEKRLGTKKGLIAQISVGKKSIAFGAIHIDLSSTAKDRANQLKTIVENLPQTDMQIVGGDWNCGTFNLRRKWEILTQSLGKLITIGFTKAIGHYMTPEKKYERPLFKVLEDNNFDYNSFNDRLKGTIYFDINDVLTNDKTAKFIPSFLIKYLQKKLSPWKGCVPLKIDWLAGKNAVCKNAQTIEKPNSKGVQLSDHNPIFIDIDVC